jgi:hypothetical protein
VQPNKHQSCKRGGDSDQCEHDVLFADRARVHDGDPTSPTGGRRPRPRERRTRLQRRALPAHLARQTQGGKAVGTALRGASRNAGARCVVF